MVPERVFNLSIIRVKAYVFFVAAVKMRSSIVILFMAVCFYKVEQILVIPIQTYLLFFEQSKYVIGKNYTIKSPVHLLTGKS